jgi:hypothetical protein
LAVRREHGGKVLARASEVIVIDETIEKRAFELTGKGVAAIDAFNLAAAESALLDYFCTCDDQFYRRAKRIAELRVKVVTPLELIEVLEK